MLWCFLDTDLTLIRDQTTLLPTAPTTIRTPIVIPTQVPDPNKWLVFDGRTWIVYDFSQLPDEYLRENYQETLNIRFKTDARDGLLWYTGDSDNHAHLTLKVELSMRQISGFLDFAAFFKLFE